MLWAALAIFAVAVVASSVFLALRTLELWRGFRAASSDLGDALERVTESADEAGRKADALGSGSERVAEAAARLAESRARLAVLTSALADVRAAVGAVTLRK